MRIAILDPSAGISGDMILGALLDSGLDPAWLMSLPARLGFPSVKVSRQPVTRCSVRATKVDFDIREAEHTGHGRHLRELIEIVGRADITEAVRERAIRVITLLGEAEGRVHGVPPDRVHLHEVGAIDAMLDIVGGIEGFERLGVGAVYHRPVAIGNGWVDAAHGKLPVPAPATLHLLEGIEVLSGGPVSGEATTPTGAALLRVLTRGAPPPSWRAVASGWGAGSRDPQEYPNALRLIIGEAAAEAGAVEVLATDIDDLSPEYVEPLREALLQAGAVDCQTWSTHSKKGRCGTRVEALVPIEASDAVIRCMFTHSTSIGVRRWPALRSTLNRHSITVELATGDRVRVKVREGPLGPRAKAEYDDVVAAASSAERPAWELAREAERLAEALLRESGHGEFKSVETVKE